MSNAVLVIDLVDEIAHFVSRNLIFGSRLIPGLNYETVVGSGKEKVVLVVLVGSQVRESIGTQPGCAYIGTFDEAIISSPFSFSRWKTSDDMAD